MTKPLPKPRRLSAPPTTPEELVARLDQGGDFVARRVVMSRAVWERLVKAAENMQAGGMAKTPSEMANLAIEHALEMLEEFAQDAATRASAGKKRARKPRCKHPNGWWRGKGGLFYCESCKRPMDEHDKKRVAEFEVKAKAMGLL